MLGDTLGEWGQRGEREVEDRDVPHLGRVDTIGRTPCDGCRLCLQHNGVGNNPSKPINVRPQITVNRNGHKGRQRDIRL